MRAPDPQLDFKEGIERILSGYGITLEPDADGTLRGRTTTGYNIDMEVEPYGTTFGIQKGEDVLGIGLLPTGLNIAMTFEHQQSDEERRYHEDTMERIGEHILSGDMRAFKHEAREMSGRLMGDWRAQRDPTLAAYQDKPYTDAFLKDLETYLESHATRIGLRQE